MWPKTLAVLAAALFISFQASAKEMVVGELVQTPIVCNTAGVTMIINGAYKDIESFWGAVEIAVQQRLCITGNFDRYVKAIDREFISFEGLRTQVLLLDGFGDSDVFTLNTIVPEGQSI